MTDTLPGADALLKRLAWAGMGTFFLISAFDIHRWRRDPWQAFDTIFGGAAWHIFGQPPSPIWLYAVAFPFVALNFACLVQLARGRRTVLGTAMFWPFAITSLLIAVMPLIGFQYAAIYRIVWADILTLLGYGIGGAIALILYVQRRPDPISED